MSIVSDETCPLGDRDDAAMELGSSNDPRVEIFLTNRVTLTDEDDIIIDACQDSLRDIRFRKVLDAIKGGDVSVFRDLATSLDFQASCNTATASLLGTLAASKPGGRFLEPGTGIGFGTAHLLAGMDSKSRLEKIELDGGLSAASQSLLNEGPQITLTVSDGAAWIEAHADARYDFIFADTWPGKFSALEQTLALLAPDGIYLINDLLPQPNWPDGHQIKVNAQRQTLLARADLHCTELNWAMGLMICTRTEVIGYYSLGNTWKTKTHMEYLGKI